MKYQLMETKMSEQKDLEEAVDKFAEAIKARLNSKRKQGWYG